MTARCEEAGDHAVAGLETLDLSPYVLDHADELVAQHGPLVHGRVSMEDVQVGTADGSERHLHQRLARTLDARLGNVGDLDVPLALKGQRLHTPDSKPLPRAPKLRAVSYTHLRAHETR